MADVYQIVGCLALITGIQGVIITEPSEKTLVVAHKQEVILWCNFSYTSTENGNTRIEAQLYLNGTGQDENVYTYEQNGGGGGNTISPALLNHFQSRTDIEELREPLAIGLKIKQAQWDDSGNYTWSMVVDRILGTAHTNVHTNDLIVGWKPTGADLQYSQVGDTIYNLTCSTIGGNPVPDVTIFKNANAIQTLVSGVPVSVTLNITSESVFICTATNKLGSVNSSLVLLPERPTTTELVQDGTTTPTPQPLEAHYIAIIAVGGCCVVVIVIIAVVCIHKHSAKKRQANPDKENTTGAGVGNQYDEMPMDNSKYQQEQEKKHQKDVKGRQHDQGPRGNTKRAGGDGRNKRVANADPNAEETEQEQEKKQQKNVKGRQHNQGPRGTTKPAGGDGRNKRVANADSNAEETEQEQEEKQQKNVEGLQYADLDLRPTREPKPAGGDGRNKLVFNDDSHVEYAEVRKV